MHTYWNKVAAACLLALPAWCRAQSVVDPDLTVEAVIASGSLSLPTAMAFLADGDLLVAEKNSGQVKRVLNGAVQSTIALDLAVANNSERGLLGLALDPRFEENSLVYVYYTRSDVDGGSAIDHRISRFAWDGLTLNNEEIVLTLPAVPGGPNHDGGVILFGPPGAAPADQKLFAVIGDLNRDNQTENWASGAPPDDTGVILRINPDGSSPTGADRGPFFDVAGGNASLERMFAYGVRNSFGLGFDPLTDALWDTENGPGDYDEINRVDPAFNSGWEDIMGPTGFPNTDKGAPGKVQFDGVGTYSDPEFSWRDTVAPTGIHFLRSNRLGAQHQFDCFVGDSNNGRLYRFEPNAARDGFDLSGDLADLALDIGESNADIVFGTGFGSITDIETGPDGAMYVLSLGSGQIFRIVDPTVVSTGVSQWEIY